MTQALVAGALFGTAGHACAQAAPSAAPASSEQLERVTITAEKRETVLEMKPDAISVPDAPLPPFREQAKTDEDLFRYRAG